MNRKLWENLVSLYGVHILNYVVPLFTMPYLARVLGPGHWGSLAFAEAYAAYVSIIVEYGFGFSASRNIAQVRHDPEARATQMAGVLGAQAFLAICALVTTTAVLAFSSAVSPYRSLLPIAFLLAVSRSVIPMWYFQGMERMRVVASLNITANLLAAIAIFLLVHAPKDTWIPLCIRGGAAVMSAIPAFIIAFGDIPFRRPTLALAKEALRSGSSLFLFRSAVSLYTTANVLILGAMAPAIVVAWYAGAEKIAKAACGGIAPITQAFFPRISYLLKADPRQAKRAALASVWLTIGVGVATGALLSLGAPLLIRGMLGPGFSQSIPVLRLLGLLPPMIAASNVFGVQWMLALRLDKYVNAIILFAGALNVSLSVVLAPRYQQMGMAAGVVFAETFITASIVALLFLKRLGPWNSVKDEGALAAA